MGLVYLDSWPALLDHAGTMSFQISPDTLHLSPVGYALFGGALVPALRRLLAPR
jgi:lysophospholipase L1-like esterase